jgi:hypothetical protein
LGVVGLLVGNGFPYVYLLGCGDNVTVNGPSGSGGDGSGGTGSGNTTSGVGVTSGTTSVGSNVTTATTSGVGGGSNLPPPTQPCWECIEKSSDLCAQYVEQCRSDLACQVLFNCYEQCGWSGSCVQQCNSIVPGAVPMMTTVMQCVGCMHCPDACAGTSLMLFCN